MSARDEVLPDTGPHAESAPPELRDLLETGGLCVLLRTDGTVVAASASYVRAMRLSADQLLGRPATEGLADRAGADDRLASVARVVRTHSPDAMPLQRRLLLRAGARAEERYWSRVNFPVLGPDGEVAYVLHRVEEVTDLVRHRPAGQSEGPGGGNRRPGEHQVSQEWLEEAYAVLRAATEGIQDAVFVKDVAGRYLMINSAGARFLGRAPAEVVGRTDMEFFPADVARKIQEDDRRIMAEGRTRTFEDTVPSAEGATVYRATKGPYRDRDGRIIGLIGISRDVTERKRAMEALRESEERYRDLFENASDIIYSHDLAGNITSFNKAGEQILGYPLAEVLGMNIAQLVTPESLELARRMTARKMAEGGRTIYELTAVAKDGRRPILEISSRLLHRDGKAVGVQGIARDITLRKQAEEALRETDRRKDEFLAMLGHELRNPLAPIRNAVRVLRDQPVGDPAATAMHDMIDRQVRQLTRLVDDLLDMSRINRGLVELRKEPVGLSAVASRAVETTRPLFEERRHRLEVSLPAEPLMVDADPARLEQMVSNLLNNAARYTQPGGRVGLTVGLEGNEAVVRVEDTGIGIPPELVPRLFDLFTQGDRVPGVKTEGLGIGLTLVRRLAEMHGGSVTASSPGPGQGSAFVVRLPLSAEESGPASPEKAAPARVQPQRVLVVDDNVDAAVSLAMVLRAEGHEVGLAHDGPTALAVAGALRPEAVFLDIGLPKGMDGYEVARRLRDEIGLQDTKLAALTGYGQQKDRARSRAAGFDHHFVKPVDTEVLLEVLSSWAAPPAR